MKKKYITKLMIAACLSSALSLNSCIEEVFPESSTATIDQIGKSDQAISAMVNSVVALLMHLEVTVHNFIMILDIVDII